MTDRVLELHRLDDPRITDADIAAAVREFGNGKKLRGDKHTHHEEKFLNCIVDLAIINAGLREAKS